METCLLDESMNVLRKDTTILVYAVKNIYVNDSDLNNVLFK
ncbi:MAG: hypothetical protein RR636_11090 [Clostridium sp.]